MGENKTQHTVADWLFGYGPESTKKPINEKGRSTETKCVWSVEEVFKTTASGEPKSALKGAKDRMVVNYFKLVQNLHISTTRSHFPSQPESCDHCRNCLVTEASMCVRVCVCVMCVRDMSNLHRVDR